MLGTLGLLSGTTGQSTGIGAGTWVILVAVVLGAVIVSFSRLVDAPGRQRFRRGLAALARGVVNWLAASAPGYNAFAPFLPGGVSPVSAGFAATDFREDCRRMFDEIDRCLDDPELIADARRRLLR